MTTDANVESRMMVYVCELGKDESERFAGDVISTPKSYENGDVGFTVTVSGGRKVFVRFPASGLIRIALQSDWDD